MRAKWETISIIFIEKMIIDELNFLIEELFVTLKEIDNLIIYLWHEGFFPVVHSVFFISFIFFPFSTWIIFINALKTVILRYFYKFFTIKVLAIVAILLYLTSWTYDSRLFICTIITIITNNHMRMISPGKTIIFNGSYVFINVILILMNSFSTSVVLVILEFKLHNFFSRWPSLTKISSFWIRPISVLFSWFIFSSVVELRFRWFRIKLLVNLVI